MAALKGKAGSGLLARCRRMNSVVDPPRSVTAGASQAKPCPDQRDPPRRGRRSALLTSTPLKRRITLLSLWR